MTAMSGENSEKHWKQDESVASREKWCKNRISTCVVHRLSAPLMIAVKMALLLIILDVSQVLFLINSQLFGFQVSNIYSNLQCPRRCPCCPQPEFTFCDLWFHYASPHCYSSSLARFFGSTKTCRLDFFTGTGSIGLQWGWSVLL